MIKGFDPIICEGCKILILGSIPSIASLSKQEYYAHPSNRFWRLMGVLLGEEVQDYASKQNLLLSHSIALWDVINMCEREGSLDSAIENEVSNDIAWLIDRYPKIELIICNGKKAYQVFCKQFPALWDMAVYCPSTSAANAGSSFEDLLLAWGKYITK